MRVPSSLWNWKIFAFKAALVSVSPFSDTCQQTHTSIISVLHSTWNGARYSMLKPSSLHTVTIKNPTAFLPPHVVVPTRFLFSSFTYWTWVQNFILFHLVLPRIWFLPLFCQNLYPNLVTLRWLLVLPFLWPSLEPFLKMTHNIFPNTTHAVLLYSLQMRNVIIV